MAKLKNNFVVWIAGIMILIFILEIVVVVLSDSKLTSLIYLFWLNCIIAGILIWQARNNNLRRIDFIKKINDDAENSLNATLDHMPIGVIRFHPETHQPEWFNPYVDTIYLMNSVPLNDKSVNKIIETFENQNQKYITIGKRQYAISLDREKHLIYLSDATIEANAKADYSQSRAVIGSISVDNYDEATDLMTDTERTQVNSFIAANMDEFADKYGLFMRRATSSRYYFFCDYKILSNLTEKKFDILDDFRQKSAEKNFPLTLSIGVSYGWQNYPAIGKTALNNLELALIRGGDQVVLRENTPQAKSVYFGGDSESRTQKSRTRARAVATALRTIVAESENVFVMGHRYPDMDALGAAVAMKTFANMTGKEAYVVYDKSQLLPDVARAIDKMNQDADGFAHILQLDSANEKKKPNSLLIMVDHSKISQTMSKEFYESFDKVVVIDHHRRDDDFPTQALLNYIESSASSASELATELLQFHGNKQRRMTGLEASIILAGISMDTQNFSKSTTVKTFEAAAFLRSRGADNDTIKNIMATDFEKYKKVNEIVLNAEFVAENVVVALGNENERYDNISTSKAADTLLDMANVTAAFTITNHENGYVSVSARSRNGFNVQTIMEELGGGGHFNVAATQVYEKTTTEVKNALLEILKERGK